MVRNHALHILYTIFPQLNFYFFIFIVAGRSAQLGISRSQNEWEAGNTIALLPTNYQEGSKRAW
jgi:hypothetical protein